MSYLVGNITGFRNRWPFVFKEDLTTRPATVREVFTYACKHPIMFMLMRGDFYGIWGLRWDENQEVYVVPPQWFLDRMGWVR